MTILGWLTGNWQWVVGAIGAVVVALGLRQSGKNAVLAKQAKEVMASIDRGRKAQTKAASALRGGKSPEQVVRDNDGKWQ